MIRNLLTIIVFFFGPAILMFVARNLLLLLKARLLSREERRAPQVIDITPVEERRAPAWFKLLAVGVGLISAWLAWQYLHGGSEAERRYVPAHVDETGKVVSGHWQSVPASKPVSSDR